MSHRLYNEQQLAKLTGLSLSKIRQDRHFCRGIPYIKIGRSVRYSSTDIERFILDNRIDPSRAGGNNAS